MRFTIQVQLEKCKIRVFRSQHFEVDKYCVREYTVKNLGRVSHRVGLMWPVHRHYPPFMLQQRYTHFHAGNVPLTICCSFNGGAVSTFTAPRRVIPPSSGLQLNFTPHSPFQHFATSAHRSLPEAPSISSPKEIHAVVCLKPPLLDQSVRRNGREKDFKKRKCVV